MPEQLLLFILSKSFIQQINQSQKESMAMPSLAHKARMLTNRFSIHAIVLIFALIPVLGLVINPATTEAADVVYEDATVLDILEDGGDDDTTGPYELPFEFDFYDQSFTEFYVTTNGIINFSEADDDYIAEDLSQGGLGDYALYPLWADLDSFGYNTVFTKTLGEEGSRQFIIQYGNHGDHEGVDRMPFSTFQVILNEADNSIQFQYKYLLGGERATGVGDEEEEESITVGIADGQGAYEQFLFNQPLLEPGLAISFTPDGEGGYVLDDEATYQEVYLRAADQPEAPVLTPANGAEDINLNTILSWDEVEGATSYDVFVATSPDMSLDSLVYSTGEDGDDEVLEVTELEIGLEPETTYYWMVVANDDDNTLTREVSGVQSFTTKDLVRNTITVDDCNDWVALTDENRFDHIELTADINCDGHEVASYGEENRPFAGTLNGNGHEISNVTIDEGDSEDVGLIGAARHATVQNLRLRNFEITGGMDVGSLIGDINDDVSVENVQAQDVYVYATNEFEDGGGYVGGLIGDVDILPGNSAVFRNLGITGEVYSESDGDNIGGMFGMLEAYGGQILVEKVYAAVDVTSTSNFDVGGLMGETEADTNLSAESSVTIRDAYATGDVLVEEEYDAGGLIGHLDIEDEEGQEPSVTIQRAYASGSVTSLGGSGGLVGWVDFNEGDGTYKIEYSFATGQVTATENYAGGIVGNDDSGTLTIDHTYFDVARTGVEADDCSGSTAIDEDQCVAVNEGGSQASYFFNNTANPPLDVWDFDAVWQTTATYPVLRAVSSLVTVNSAENGSLIRLEQTGCLTIEDVSASKESGLAVQDSGYNYPVGLISFKLTGCSQGGTATVTATFTGTFDPSAVVARKYNPATHGYLTIPGAVASVTTLNGNAGLQIVYSITDGGDLDQDGTANSEILDPMGLALSAVGTPNTGFGPFRR